MLILLLFLLMHTVSPDGSGGVVNDHYTYNLTLNHLTPRSIAVSWNCEVQRVYDKHEVTLQQYGVSYKIVEPVPHNTCYLVMDNLVPETKYQISVASSWTQNKTKVRRRSSYLHFLTPSMEDPEGEQSGIKSGLKLPNVKVVEISLVAMALILWAGAIVLFFHRWGKIRMLLPYQPAYKEMKPTGSSTCTNCSMTPHHQCSRLQQLQMTADYGPVMGTAAASVSAGITSLGLVTFTKDTGCSPMRGRLNSFVAFDQSELPLENTMRIYRKALSCDHLPVSDKFWFDDDISDA